jgi:hypothetical protein
MDESDHVCCNHREHKFLPGRCCQPGHAAWLLVNGVPRG